MRQARAIVSISSALLAVLLLAGDAWAIRHQLDSQDLARMQVSTPEVAQLFAQGEAHLAKAELKQAAEVFARVRASAPESGLAARRHCQALTELGQREEAMAACLAARRLSRTVMELRATVGAMMSGDKPPTVEDLAGAIRLAQLAKRLPEQPFGDAALCEIAYRIGDSGMLRKCVESLQRIAPGHYETRRWSAALDAQPAWPFWLGWGALALGACATVVHALVHRARVRGRVLAATSALLALVVATCARPSLAQSSEAATTPAPAISVERIPADQAPADRTGMHWQLSDKFVIDPNDPVRSVPSNEEKNSSPMQFGYYLQDLSSEAAYAERRQEFEKAAKFWAAVSLAVPDVAVGYRRACRAYQRAGAPEKALVYCAGALRLLGVMLEDYIQYGTIMLAKPKLEALDIADLDAVIEQMRTSRDAQPDSSIAGERLACGLGIELNDEKRLTRCTDALNKLAKADLNTLFYRWNLAMLRQDYKSAKALLVELKQAKMEPAALARAQEVTAKASAWWLRPLKDWRYGAGLIALLALVAGLVAQRRRRNKPPAPSAPGPDVDPAAAAG